jgi:MYND finger
MERGDVKRGRGAADEENVHVSDALLRKLPLDVLEHILKSVDELSPTEIIYLSNPILRVIGTMTTDDTRVEQARTRLWLELFQKRFNVSEDYYYTKLKRDMPNPMLAFMAHACASALKQSSLEFSKMLVLPPSVYVGREEKRMRGVVHLEFDSNDDTILGLLTEVDGMQFLYAVPAENRFITEMVRLTKKHGGWGQGDRDMFFNAKFDTPQDAHHGAMIVVYQLLSRGYEVAAKAEVRRRIWKTKQCIGCNVVEATSVCTRCEQAHYCSRACQAAHWERGHREECGK